MANLDVTSIRTKNEVITQFCRLNVLYETGMVTNHSNFKNPFYISVLIEKLILLNDLLQKISSVRRIDFSDDIPQKGIYNEKNRNSEDITDLIRFFRNAACHIDNCRRDFNESGGTVSFGMSVGEGHFLNDISSGYHDDACII